MILGSYYLTYSREEEGTGHIFADKDEALLAYDAKIVTLPLAHQGPPLPGGGRRDALQAGGDHGGPPDL